MPKASWCSARGEEGVRGKDGSPKSEKYQRRVSLESDAATATRSLPILHLRGAAITAGRLGGALVVCWKKSCPGDKYCQVTTCFLVVLLVGQSSGIPEARFLMCI
jgi:hypothetical protein